MSTFFRTKTLTEEIRRFRVKVDIWNEDNQRMEVYTVDMSGYTSESRTKWDGSTKTQCYSEGLQATVYVLEQALNRARDSFKVAKELERKTLGSKRNNKAPEGAS